MDRRRAIIWAWLFTLPRQRLNRYALARAARLRFDSLAVTAVYDRRRT